MPAKASFRSLITLEKISDLLLKTASQSPKESRQFYQQAPDEHGVEKFLAAEFVDAVIVTSGLRLIEQTSRFRLKV